MNITEKVLRQKQDFDDVYKAGKKAEYDAFWDSLLVNNDCSYRFGGTAWNDTTFKPKRDIIGLNNCISMFANNMCTNIKGRLQEQGVKLDMSKATNVGQCFYYSSTLELPEIDLSNATIIGTVFAYSKVKSIDKVTFKDGMSFSNCFHNCLNLEEIRIGGMISGSGFDIHWSTKLTADSLASIINALSTTTTGLTITLPSTAQSNYESKYGSGSWATLTATKSNWTIAYA